MKKIALIMDGWKRYLTFAWPAGILRRIARTNEEINLYIFSSSGGWSGDEDYDTGEYNIYNLPDLKEFAGIIIDLNNIRDERVYESVIRKVRAAGVPVISIENKIDGFYYVGIDNEKMMREMIAHLFYHHRCRKFWLIMGSEKNYESRHRKRALCQFLAEKGITISDENIYQGSFEYECGVRGFLELYEKHGQLPDAVICGSDNIAVGVCEEARKKGFFVPKDFLVTGFDDFDKALYYKPRLTTIRHVREDVGELCVDLFLKLWAGERVQPCNYTDAACIFRESCGCGTDEMPDEEYGRKQIMRGIETRIFDEQVLALDYELMCCSTLQEMMCRIPKSIPSLKCDAMYLVVDPHMDEFREQKEVFYNAHFLENEGFCVNGYPERMKVVFSYENGKVKKIETPEISDIFPMFEAKESGVDFLFLPVHFKEHSVGYLVIRNAVYLMEKQYLFSVVKMLINAMENLHKREKLAFMNETLEKMSIRDSMTGMYNRLGYQKMTAPLFGHAIRRKKSLLIMYIDLDRLKYINDSFGHEYGDFAITATAKAILNHSKENGIPARMGGDEFVLIQDAQREQEWQEIAEKITDELKCVSERMKVPFEVSVSIGGIVVQPKEGDSLEKYLKIAETMMYQQKMNKKVNRTE